MAASAVLGLASPASAAGSTVTGTVTCSGVPLATYGTAQLYTWDGTNSTLVGTVGTDASGIYTLSNVAAGTYLLRFSDGRTFTDDRCAPEWSGAGHAYTRSGAGSFSVGSSGTVSVSESLATGAHVDAHVVYGAGQTPAFGAVLYQWADFWTIDVLGATDASGDAHLTGLIPGGTRLSTFYTGYQPEFYNDWNNFGSADLVTASAGSAAPAMYVWINSAGGSATYFSDVPSTSTFYSAIQWMGTNGISTGTPVQYLRPLYKPVDPVSRQAMALFLFRVSGDSGTYTPSSTPHFADVPNGSPSFAAAQWMYEMGISTGTAQPSGLPLFKPTDAVSRQAMAQFLFRMVDPSTVTNPSPYFADVPNSSTFFASIQWMYEVGISTGTAQPSGLPLYKPGDPVSRQAMAQFLHRFAGP